MITSKVQWGRAVQRLQAVIERTGVANGIDEEKWKNGFMDELRLLSKEEASELGKGILIVDKGTNKLTLEKWVHARVLYMILDLVAWMGPQWSTHFKRNGEPMTEEQFLDLVKQAFESGFC
jgi:hypothetical protein